MNTITVVRGSDPVLLSDRLRSVINELVGEADASLVVDEYTGEDVDIGAVIDAAQTPPLFSDHRVIVLRGASRFSKADDVAPLISYLENPLETSTIVVAWEPVPGQARLSTIPKKLAEAIAAAHGEIIATDPGSTRANRDDWWADTFSSASIALDQRAKQLIKDHVADDIAMVPPLLRMLAGAFGEGATLGVDDVQPFLGDSGSVPPWELTDAIDNGDTTRALDALHRMLGAGARHPLQIMATLNSHYLRIAALQGAPISGEKDAAALLGIKGSTYPAKKALTTLRSLGPSGTKRAVEICANADLTLRGGGPAWSGDLVLEVVVARLARIAAGRRR